MLSWERLQNILDNKGCIVQMGRKLGIRDIEAIITTRVFRGYLLELFLGGFYPDPEN